MSGPARLRDVAGFAPTPPTAAVALRIGLYTAVAVWALTLDVGALSEIAARHWSPRSVLRLAPGPPSREMAELARAALVASSAGAAAGLGGAVSRAVAAVTGLALMGLHDAATGALTHNHALPAMLLVALAPAPLDRWWSVRARRRRASGRPTPPWRDIAWGWPVGLARALVAITYFSSGFAKLRASGLAWLDPGSLQRWTWVKLDRMEEPSALGLVLVEHDAVAGLAAVGGLALQLSLPLALIWPRFRPVAAAGIVAFHVTTGAAMGLAFWLTAAVAWLPLVDCEGLRRRARRTARAGSRSVADAPAAQR